MASLLIGINQFGFIWLNKYKSGITVFICLLHISINCDYTCIYFLKERFSNFQTIAIFLAVIAIILLSLGIESFPFISIIMGEFLLFMV